jgi:hypothetical protein
MRLLLTVQCSNEWNESRPHYGIIDITPEYAQSVLKYMEAVAPLEEIGGFYMAEFFDYSVEYGDLPEGYGENEALLELVGQADELGYVELPSNMELHLDEARTDCNTIAVSKGDVFYAAADKYTSDRLECELIPRALFEQVAQQVTA